MQSYNKNVVTKTDQVDISAVALSFLLSPDASNRIQEGKPRYYLLSIPWGGLTADGVPQIRVGKDLHNNVIQNYANQEG